MVIGRPQPPDPRERSATGAPPATGQDGGAHESAHDPARDRIGPVAIERHVKDDGRALILYSDTRHAEDPPPRA